MAEQAIDERGRLIFNDEQPAVPVCDKPLLDLVGKHLAQRIEEAVYIEQAHRLVVDAQLDPGDRLEQLFQCTNAPRQGDKCVCKLCHAGFALVHGLDDLKMTDRFAGYLLGSKRTRDDSVDGCAAGVGCPADGTHESQIAAAIDQPIAPPRNLLSIAAA